MPVQGLRKKRFVLGQAGDVLSRSHPFAKRQYRQIDVRQDDEGAKPEDGRSQQ